VIGRGEREAQEAYGVVGQCMFLVRPDGYVAFRSQPVDVMAVMRYLRSTLGVKGLPQSLDIGQHDSDRTSRVFACSREGEETITRLLVVTIVLLIVNIAVAVYPQL